MARTRSTALASFAVALASCGGAGGPAPPPLTGATAISLSSTHACALMGDGTARCWGQDAFGQLGDGVTAPAVARPVTVADLSQLVAVVAGFDHSCGLVGDGAVACWGSDVSGQIGAATKALTFLAPTGVDGLGPSVDALATAGAAGALGAYTCAHMVDDTVQCWGANTLNLDGTAALSIAPTTIDGLAHVRTMALGGVFACFALQDGTVSCLGRGALGSAAATASAAPVTVAGLSGVEAIAAGSLHACALMSDATVQCWGAWKGNADVNSPPAQVDGVVGATSLAAGGGQTCARLEDGGVSCWGAAPSASPTRVKGLGAASALGVGNDTACAIVTGGSIRCWGSSTDGLLGDGVLPTSGGTNVATPVTVVAGE